VLLQLEAFDEGELSDLKSESSREESLDKSLEFCLLKVLMLLLIEGFFLIASLGLGLTYPYYF
jgi:hypothetical protein